MAELRVKQYLYNTYIMHWTEKLHRLLVEISDLVNRFDVDARLMAASNVKLERALYPLLSRIKLYDELNMAELANLVGRDHSTVSRQVARLEELGLIHRKRCDRDKRVRLLCATPAGRKLIERIARVRRRWMEAYFADWSPEDRDRLLELMAAMMEQSAADPAANRQAIPEFLSELEKKN